jgi:hypothetical protein
MLPSALTTIPLMLRLTNRGNHMLRNVALTITGSLAIVARAAGSITTISPSPVSEKNQEQILESLYGGNFSASGTNYLGGGLAGALSAFRYKDFLSPDGIQNVSAPSLLVADKTWTTNSFFMVIARSTNSAATQQFGYTIDGGSYQNLFTVGGSGSNPTGSAIDVDLMGKNFQWVRRSAEGTNAYSSKTELNSDSLDHMVTYRIDGLNDGKTTWFLCFEDLYGPLAGSGNSDRDFNDLCVQVTTASVPEPSTIAVLGFGFAGMLRRMRRKR